MANSSTTSKSQTRNGGAQSSFRRNNEGRQARSLVVVDADAKTSKPRKTARTQRAGSKSVAKSRTTKAKTVAAKPRVKVAPKPKKTNTQTVVKSSGRSAGGKKATSSKPAIKLKKSKTAPKHSKTPKLGTEKTTTGLKREPLGHLLVETKLREAGFRGTVSSDKLLLDAYSTDESIFAIRPQIVLQPENQRDVEIAVCVVAENTKVFPSLSLTPRAAGTGLSGGSLTDSAVIDVSHGLTAIEEPVTSKDGVTITCEPGANFREVEKKLEPHKVYLPAYPASKDICSIGGAVANNAAGPDSLKHGHMAEWVESMKVVLQDGKTYTIEPLSYKQFKTLAKKQNAHAEIARRIFHLIEKNEKTIIAARPATRKNTAGFPLWDVLSVSVADFKSGKGTFDLTRLMCGSQGTLGVMTELTLRTEPVPKDVTLLVLPIFDLECAGRAIIQALKYDPVNIEVFDDISFDLALQNPDFFKDRVTGLSYYKVMFSLYTMYHVRYRRNTPKFTILVTIDNTALEAHRKQEIITELQSCGCNVVRFVKTPEEREMWWQIRRASYSLSKKQDHTKRPAAFLEDMTVPPQNLFGFFADIQVLFKKYDITAAVHGHGGNGHFHFYPLMDFEKSETSELIEEMSEAFFDCAIRHGGSLCGEHNDGIIRTPHLSKMYAKPVLKLFADVETIFDPDDIFNPGKKSKPRFDIKDSIRKTN